MTIDYPKFKGGPGGFAPDMAICPPAWKYGVSVGQVPDAPLPKRAHRLAWDTAAGVRVRR